MKRNEKRSVKRQPKRGKASGRLPAWRRRVVLASWLIAALAICVRAAQIQIVQAAHWRGLADAQHREAALRVVEDDLLDLPGQRLAIGVVISGRDRAVHSL